MGEVLIGSGQSDDVIVTPLRRIHHPKGDIYHALKSGDSSFGEFGEAYFTTVTASETKGWKQHTRMIMNLIVPVGDVSFFIHCEKRNQTATVNLGPSNYCRLTVPAGYWMAFRGHQNPLNLVLNIASIEHDPEESIDVPLDSFPIPE